MHIHAHHPSCRLDKAKIDNMLQAEGNSSSPHQQHAGELRMMRDKNMKAEIEALYTDPESAACRLGPAAAVGGGGNLGGSVLSRWIIHKVVHKDYE